MYWSSCSSGSAEQCFFVMPLICLIILDENTVARSISIKVQNAIKQKASQDEILEALKEIPDEDGEQQTNPLRVIISQLIYLNMYVVFIINTNIIGKFWYISNN